MRSPQNYFKHADKDPNTVFEFEPELAEIMLIRTCAAYGSLGEPLTERMATFQAGITAEWA
jgi:hypothetical protein